MGDEAVAILNDSTDNITAPVSAGAVYIHIPFCRKKCNYCDFASADYADRTADYADRYLKVLAKEFVSYSSLVPRPPSLTLYIGGGTPSLLSENQIRFLFNNLFESADIGLNPLNPGTEITFELNPESATKEKLRVLKKCGVNRLSIGAQSFDNGILEFLGRVHMAEDFFKCYNLARETGFDNINVDLMFGIPGQTMKNWRDTLKSTLPLNPEHISVYSLTVEEGTNFFNRGIEKDADTDADMYGYAIRFLKEAGYRHYEISNFSKPQFECRHNINYWNNGEYLGFGLAAASHIKGIRIKNTENMGEYLGGNFNRTYEELEPFRKISENMMLGLRLIDGVKLERRIKKKFARRIENLKTEGLLSERNNFLKLTGRGIMFANRVFCEFV